MNRLRLDQRTVLAVTGNGLSGLSGLAAMVLYARALPESQFGLYATAFAITALISIAGGLGLADYVVRSLAEDDDISSGSGRRIAVLWIGGASGGALLAAGLLLPFLHGQYAGLLLPLSILVTAPVTLLAASLRINSRFGLVAVVLSVMNVTRCGIGVLLLTLDWTFSDLCIATAVASCLLAIPVWIALLRWHTDGSSVPCLTGVLRNGSPYLIGNLLGTARNSLDVVIVAAMLGVGPTAVFAAAMLLAKRSGLLSNAIADVALLPDLMRLARESTAAFKAQAWMTTLQLAGLGLLVAGVVAAIGVPLLELMGYPEAMPLYLTALALIPVRFGVHSLSAALKFRHTAVGRMRDQLLSLLVLVTCMFILVSPLGLWGALVSVAVADLGLLVCFSRRLAKLP